MKGPPKTGIVVSPSLTPRSGRVLCTSAAFLTVLAAAGFLVALNGKASAAGGAVGVAIGAAICAAMVVFYLARRPYIRVVLHPGSITNGATRPQGLSRPTGLPASSRKTTWSEGGTSYLSLWR